MSSPTEAPLPLPPKSPPPPPPRRTVSAAHPSPSPSPSRPASSLWARARAATTTTWDATYKLSDKVGVWTNAQAAKVGTEAFYPTSLEIESAKAARILRTFTMDTSDLPEESIEDAKKTQKVLRKIPPSALEHAQGIAIFTVLRTGFLVSGSGGSGVVLARLNDGSWSAPSGILLHTVGFGFLAGVDVYDVVLVLRTQSAVQSFTHPRFSLGGEVNVALGPTGAGHLLETSIDAAPSPVWSYSKSKGVYAGVQLDGQILIERDDENERSYGRKIKASEILAGEVSPLPLWCDGLHQTILAASGKPHDPTSIPSGISPSDLPHPGLPTSSSSSSISSSGTARRLPVQDLDEEDLQAQREMEAALLSFGIEDPSINQTARKEDPLLVVEREDLDSPRSSRSLASPPLAAEQEREAGYGAEAILSEDVEQPPEEQEMRRRSGGSGLGSVLNSPKPPLPPRRVKVEQEEVMKNDEEEEKNDGEGVEKSEEEEKSEEKSEEKGEEKGEEKSEGGEGEGTGDATPEFKDAVDLEGEVEGEKKGDEVEEEGKKDDATEAEEEGEGATEKESKEGQAERGEEKKDGEGEGDKQ